MAFNVLFVTCNYCDYCFELKSCCATTLTTFIIKTWMSHLETSQKWRNQSIQRLQLPKWRPTADALHRNSCQKSIRSSEIPLCKKVGVEISVISIFDAIFQIVRWKAFLGRKWRHDVDFRSSFRKGKRNKVKQRNGNWTLRICVERPLSAGIGWCSAFELK